MEHFLEKLKDISTFNWDGTKVSSPTGFVWVLADKVTRSLMKSIQKSLEQLEIEKNATPEVVKSFIDFIIFL